MKTKIAIAAGIIGIGFGISSCFTPSPESKFLTSMQNAGVEISESDIDTNLQDVQAYCDYDYESYIFWKTVNEIVSDELNQDSSKIESAYNDYCVDQDPAFMPWSVLSA